MVKISVIIVTWNAQMFIRKCLESLFAQDIEDIEVFVVDNGSTDKTVEILKEFKERIYLIENRANKGFCSANNQALKLAHGEYILTLNSDIVLKNNYIHKLMNYLERHKSVGMVQGKFLRMDKKTLDGIGLYLSPFLRMFNIGEGKPDLPLYNKEREIFGPCAAAALYRRMLLDDVRTGEEFFDDSFFFLVEDFDLAWRARKRGWKAMYVPEAVCYHYRDSSAYKSSFRQYLSFRNRYFMIIKNFSFKNILNLFFSLVFYDIPRIIYLLINNRYTLKALAEIKMLYPEMRKKRYK